MTPESPARRPLARSLLRMGVAAAIGVPLLSACVVVPAPYARHPGHYYRPPVVVVPPPVWRPYHRHHQYQDYRSDDRRDDRYEDDDSDRRARQIWR
jgi:hypothetical protein